MAVRRLPPVAAAPAPAPVPATSTPMARTAPLPPPAAPRAAPAPAPAPRAAPGTARQAPAPAAPAPAPTHTPPAPQRVTSDLAAIVASLQAGQAAMLSEIKALQEQIAKLARKNAKPEATFETYEAAVAAREPFVGELSEAAAAWHAVICNLHPYDLDKQGKIAVDRNAKPVPVLVLCPGDQEGSEAAARRAAGHLLVCWGRKGDGWLTGNPAAGEEHLLHYASPEHLAEALGEG